MPLAYIILLDGHRRPVDPGWGVEGPVDPGYGVEAPVDPGWGVGRPVRPSHPIVRPGRPGRPVDPGYGVDEGNYVDNTLPPEAGSPENPIVLPPDGEPGSPSNPIVLPPGRPAHPIAGPSPKGNVVVWIPGRGYVVVQPGVGPDNSLPGGGVPPAAPKR